MPDLFDEAAGQARQERAPLPDRMRPRTLKEFVGQDHILGEGKLLRRAIEADRDKKGLGHGEGYKYPHAYREHYVPEQYLPDAMQGTYFYAPTEQGYEAEVAERLARWRERDADEDAVKRARRYAESADATNGDAGA